MRRNSTNREDLQNSVNSMATAFSEPARTSMMLALMDGRALTAKELAYRASVVASTASAHLAILQANSLVTREVYGRNHYFRISGDLSAQLVEQLMSSTEVLKPRALSSGPTDDLLRRARCCWNHLAGRLGVVVAGRIEADGASVLTEGTYVVAPRKSSLIVALLGDDMPDQYVCRACLDWSERKPHIGGSLGKALLAALLRRGLLVQTKDSRALETSSSGHRFFSQYLEEEAMDASEKVTSPRRRATIPA